MATDFFDRQARSRRKTKLLVFYMAMAVTGIVLVLTLVVSLAFFIANEGHGDFFDLITPQMFLAIAFAVLAIVGLGTLYKMWRLKSGGTGLAKRLGGTRVEPGTKDPLERRLLNVMQEMSIASGYPLPVAYVLNNEPGINAFAAGHGPTDAAIGVTRGCLETLNRAEMQGVVAHEYSHLFHGDSRLNLRLIGVVHGILVIGMIGYLILRSPFHTTRSSRSGNNNGGAILAIVGFGLAVMAVGYIGTFFGNLIKAAVSRQREYLADSSALQYTREPTGLAGALKKIGGFVKGSKLATGAAPQASHMYFAKGFTPTFANLLATHPPLESRILAIEPGWDGKFPELKQKPTPEQEQAMAKARADAKAKAKSSERFPIPVPALAGAVDSVGQVGPEHVEQARLLLENLPAGLKEAAEDPDGARAVIYSLLMDRDDEVRQRQFEYIDKSEAPGMSGVVERLLPQARDLAGGESASQETMALLDICLPALRAMPKEYYEPFTALLKSLIKADKRVDLFEWMLLRAVRRHVGAAFGRVAPARVKFSKVRDVAEECGVLLSALAHAGSLEEKRVKAAFALARKVLGEKVSLAEEMPGLGQLNQVLDRLNCAAPEVKRDILKASAACIEADQTVTSTEYELLRAVADGLDCPMPVLASGQAA